MSDRDFDVLSILNNLESVDMIQALMGNKCLGIYFKNDTAELYFNSGFRKQMNIKLDKLLKDQSIKWVWKTQAREDWHLTWQNHFKPVMIDDKLAVIPYWKNDHLAEITIKIKPGMAFGTGHHETTWLMLKQMLKYLQPGMSVLDLGSGSGILSIAARKIGAEKVDSVEFDIECKANFYENLELNGIKEEIQFHNVDVLNWTKLDYDLILANMNQNIIEKLIPLLKKIDGTFLLSGLLDKNFDTIKQLCQRYQLQVKEKLVKGEWICLAIG